MELTRRRSARTDVLSFARYTMPGYRVGEHHRLICDKLQAVERGEIDRLIVCMPPRHGKSELVSKRFPAWYLGRNASKQFISASYGADLASDFGRDVRNIIASQEFSALFPGIGLAEDSKAKNRWHTNAGGSYVAAGVGTAITGRGADILNIDDPFKDRSDADSEVQRDTVWDWYTSTAYTRLMPRGAVIVTATRWHEDDLIGRLLAAQSTGGDKWDVLQLPAINALGKALWPEAYPEPVLARFRAAIGERDWSALYQQQPTPDTGDYFKKDWFRPVQTIPPRESLRLFMGSDYAVTGNGGDYTVHVVVGLDSDDRMYLVDLWRGQSTSDVWVDAFCDLVVQWKPVGAAEETGQIRSAIGPWLDRKQLERKAWVARSQFPTRGDKAVRAQSVRGRMAAQGLYIPAGAPWRAAFEAELLSFPAGKHDDQVDALGLVGQLLDVMYPPEKPKDPPGPVDTWRRAFDRLENGDTEADWRTA